MMKAKLIFPIAVILLILAAGSTGALPAQASAALADAPTATPKPVSWRPLVVVSGYDTDAGELSPGQEFNLVLRLYNAGQRQAVNTVVRFAPGDLIPRETGGVVTIAQLIPGETKSINQPLTASSELAGKSQAATTVTISYTNLEGEEFTETVTLTFKVQVPVYGPAKPTATPTPTATAPALLRPQLVINNYTTDASPLQPGTRFKLSMTVHNLGSAMAKSVTLVFGGASVETNASGTPQAGVSGASGEFTYFAPLGSSNLVYLGDLDIGQSMSAEIGLIVNVTTNPGAFPVKMSFVYTDSYNNRIIDNQVITLLVYNLPKVEISFYRDPQPVFAGQINQLPLQIVNLSRAAVVFGNMQISSDRADLTNNISLVGAIEPGGYFTMDASALPYEAGPLEITVMVGFTDDFNQPQTISQVLTVEVQPSMDVFPTDPNAPLEPEIPVTQPETLWQKILRFLRGLFGLGSGVTTPVVEPGIIEPGDLKPTEAPVEVVPVPRKGG